MVLHLEVLAYSLVSLQPTKDQHLYLGYQHEQTIDQVIIAIPRRGLWFKTEYIPELKEDYGEGKPLLAVDFGTVQNIDLGRQQTIQNQPEIRKY